MKQQGMREYCEDIVCQHCMSVQGREEYKQCKETCITNNLKEIESCCIKQCGGDESCIESCKHDNIVLSMHTTESSNIITYVIITCVMLVIIIWFFTRRR